MSEPNNLIGERFGRLTVIGRAPNNKKGNTMWNCLCDCGKTTTVVAYSLKKGRTQSCGCYHSECVAKTNKNTKTTHGEKKTRLYRIWHGMKQRCFNPNDKDYEKYGGRGITICDEWKEDFCKFRDWALDNGYSHELSIDRIENDGNYEPNNCRWATQSQQNSNRRKYKWRNKK